MKKAISLFLVLTLVITACVLLTGCFGKGPNFEVPEEGYNGEHVEITFTLNAGQTLRAEVEKAIVEFNKLYPNISVKLDVVGSYEDVLSQLTTQIANKNAPNLAYCYPDHVAGYSSSNRIVHLDNLINSKIPVKHADGTEEPLGLTPEQIDNFVEQFYNEGRVFGDDLTYLLPIAKSTELMYYNKTFFEQHDLEVPTHWFATTPNIEDDKTSMEYVCEKILEYAEEDGYTAVVPFGYDSEDNWFITLAEEMGAGYTSEDPDNRFTFDNQKNRDMMEKLRGWYMKGYFTTKTLQKNSNTSNLLAESITNKDALRVFMSIGSSGGASYNIPDDNSFEIGVASVPQIDPANPKYILQGPDVCIFTQDDPQEVVASWLLVKFLTTDIDFQAGFSQVSGYMPVTKEIDKDEVYQNEFLAFANQGNAYIQATACKMSLDLRDKCIISPAFDGSSKSREQVGSLLVKIVSEPTDNIQKLIDDTFKDAMAECKYFAG